MDSYIPQNLDQQTRYLFFTIDELLAVAMPALVLTMVGEFIIGLGLGAGALYLLRKFKRNSSLHRLKWAAYYALPGHVFGFKATPASSLRELVG